MSLPPDERAVRFIRLLRHIRGEHAGRPFELLPWQERIVRDVFGTLRADGTRQYRTVLIETPRKVGKSTFAAAIALYLLYEGEPGAEVYSAAADRDQAAIVFETAKRMLEMSPFARMAKVYRRAIEVPALGAVYRVLSADAPTKHGLNAHGVVFDELHAQRNRELWDTLKTSMGARRQPLMVALTTAGYDQESLCWEEHEYARRVREGIVDDPTYYSVYFGADADDPWDDPRTWRKAHPSLGVTVSEQFYRDEARKARESPAYQNTFRRLYLNQWVQQSTRWIDLAVWDDNNLGHIDEDALVGRPCYGGLDLSAVRDLTAFVLVFPRQDDPEALDVVCRFWVPEARLQDPSNRWRDQYVAWADAGLLRVTPGGSIDYGFVREEILQLARRHRIESVNVDRLFQAHQLAQELEHEGLAIYGMGQGFLSMAQPMREFERRLLARKINHGGHPVLRWMADGVAVKQDPAGNLKPDKAASGCKIDGIVALVMAIDRAMRDGGRKSSPYEERGIVVI